MDLWATLEHRYRKVHEPWWAVFLLFELLVLGAWLLEHRQLRHIRATSGDPLEATTADKAYVAFWVCHFVLLQWVVSRIGRWTPPLAYSWGTTAIGLVATVCGLATRRYAIDYMAENFTYVVRVSEKQRLVTTGPYRLVRHPAYAGLIVFFAGLGLVLSDVYAVAILVACVGVVVGFRIRKEERKLASHFGDEYRAWKAKTKLLIPWVI